MSKSDVPQSDVGPWELPAISRLGVALSKGSMLHRIHGNIPSALSCLMEEGKEVVRKDRREFAGCSEVRTLPSH